MSEDTHDALPAVQQDCDRLRADVDRLAALVLEIRAERQQAHVNLALCRSERATLRAQLADARSALARIRNVATAGHAPLSQCLDWVANEAVLTLDRTAPPSDDTAQSCSQCTALRSVLEAARAVVKGRCISAEVHADSSGADEVLAQINAVLDAPSPAS